MSRTAFSEGAYHGSCRCIASLSRSLEVRKQAVGRSHLAELGEALFDLRRRKGTRREIGEDLPSQLELNPFQAPTDGRCLHVKHLADLVEAETLFVAQEQDQSSPVPEALASRLDGVADDAFVSAVSQGRIHALGLPVIRQIRKGLNGLHAGEHELFHVDCPVADQGS